MSNKYSRSSNNSKFKRPFSQFRMLLRDNSHYLKYVSDNDVNFHIRSFERFLQLDKDSKNREVIGLEKVFRKFFPMEYTKKQVSIEYLGYDIEMLQWSMEECRKLSLTYAANLKIHLRINRKLEGISEDVSYIVGELPMMCPDGTFLINGNSRIFIHQLKKAPGVLFLKEDDQTVYGKSVCTSQILPKLGAWLHIRLSSGGAFISIDKRKEMSLATFLLCFPKMVIREGEDIILKHYTLEEVLANFYDTCDIVIKNDGWFTIPFKKDVFKNSKLSHDIYINRKLVLKSGDILTNDVYNKLHESSLELPIASLQKMFLAQDLFDMNTGAILCEYGQMITSDVIKHLPFGEVIKVFKITPDNPNYLLHSLNSDGVFNSSAALVKWSSVSDIINYHTTNDLTSLFLSRFMNERYYNFENGRVRVNSKLGLDKVEKHLTFDDIVATYKNLILLENEKLTPDAVDDLSNKSVFGVCEILESAFSAGLKNLEKYLKERIGMLFLNKGSSDVLNFGVMFYFVKECFYKVAHMTNDNNYLAKLSQTHQVSYHVPGKSQNTNVPKEVRDVYSSKMFRFCGIETPEGPNTGLTEAQTAYLHITPEGLLLVKYHPVHNGIASDAIVSLDVHQEVGKVIGSIDCYDKHVSDSGEITFVPRTEYVSAKKDDRIGLFHKNEVNYISVSEGQALSRSSSLIPFISCNDSYRALVGAAMNKQAIYVCNPSAPLVSTGFDAILSHKITANRDGIVTFADANHIMISVEDNFVDIYKLDPNKKTSSDFIITQRPVVRPGDVVKAGDIIADGFSTKNGELALSQNVLVCFRVANNTYEDATAVSDSMIHSGRFTSISSQVLTVDCIDGPNGSEQLSRDLPNVPHSAVAHLDESGLPVKGCYVKSGDILVGKRVPKAVETDERVSYGEKLLNYVFAERVAQSENVSYIVPEGICGYVSDVRIFTRANTYKESRVLLEDMREINRLNNYWSALLSSLKTSLIRNIKSICGEYELLNDFKKWVKGTKLKDMSFEKCNISELMDMAIAREARESVVDLINRFTATVKKHEDEKNKKIKNLDVGFNLADGVIKSIQITISSRNPIEVGDKLAGRYANKSVVAQVVPRCDMPYLADGTSIEMDINALSVLRRMNLGQIFEVTLTSALDGKKRHLARLYEEYMFADATEAERKATIAQLLIEIKFLVKNRLSEFGFACGYDDLASEDILEITKYFIDNGIAVTLPPFSKFGDNDLRQLLKDFGIEGDGKQTIYDGKTGEAFEEKALVGYMSIAKLYHCARLKITARSTGAYNTMNQPTVGAKQKGGQRLGEMECWALEAHGAAGLLLESSTAKSSDSLFRRRLYQTLMKEDQRFSMVLSGVYSFENGANFNMIASYLRALSFDVEVLDIKNSRGYNSKAVRVRLTNKKYGLPVLSEETYNRKNFKPIAGGLFCQKIFGPVVDYTCACGKYCGIAGILCEICGVQTVHSSVRGKRMAYIELPKGIYVIHPWFLRAVNNKICALLDMSTKMLNDICSLNIGYVVKAGDTPFKEGTFISLSDYQDYLLNASGFSLYNFCIEEANDIYRSNESQVLVGGAILHHLLSKIDLNQYIMSYTEMLSSCSSVAAWKKCYNVLEICRYMKRNDIRPEYMILDHVNVLPPMYRLIVQLDNGQYMSSDYNLLYKRIISSVGRIRSLISSSVDVAVFILQELRILHDGVMKLFGGNAEDRYTNSAKEYRSIEKRLKGKEGIFRKFLLGKRVDYSARAVIAVDSTLHLDECSIPKVMALELFKPIVISTLVEMGIAHSIKYAKNLVKKKVPIVYNVLRDLVKTRCPLIILNRAPTLHAYSIMAFKIRNLIDGRAILINPQVCPHFNADFDGDSMGAHVAVSVEAIAEAKMLMMPSKKIGSLTHGALMLKFPKHMSFGVYMLTSERIAFSGKRFSSIRDAAYAYAIGKIKFGEVIEVAVTSDIRCKTTWGRLLVWSAIPVGSGVEFQSINKQMKAGELQNIMLQIRRGLNDDAVVSFANAMKDLCFFAAELYVGSFGLNDMPEVDGREEVIRKGIDKQLEIEGLYSMKLITENELRSTSTSLWQGIQDKLQEQMLGKINNGSLLGTLLKAEAGGTKSSYSQMLLLKGKVVGFDGSELLSPVTDAHRDGLRPFEYFLTCSGMRKAIVDVSANTSVSGYFERKIIHAVNNMIIRDFDCGTDSYYVAKNMFKDGVFLYDVYDIVLNRTAARDVISPATGQLIVSANQLITYNIVKKFEEHHITEVPIRSPMMCDLPVGVCACCYGAEVGSNGKLVSLGDAVGIVAAHAVGEPSTQLTMRAFHFGGVARFSNLNSDIITPFAGKVKWIGIVAIKNAAGDSLNISRAARLQVVNEHGMMLSDFEVPYGAKLTCADGVMVDVDTCVLSCSVNRLILAEEDTVVQMVNGELGVNFEYTIVNDTGARYIAITSELGSPALILNGIRYPLVTNTVLLFKDGDSVKKGEVVGYIRPVRSSLDIVGGLQKVIGLLENRAPENIGDLSPVTGKVMSIKKNSITIARHEDGVEEVCKTSGETPIVYIGQHVNRGDLITNGIPLLQSILTHRGIEGFAEYVIQKITSIYREQSLAVVMIHLEVIINALTSKYEVVQSDDPEYVVSDVLEKSDLGRIRRQLSTGRIVVRRLFDGLTNSALNCLSLLNAMGFQEVVNALNNMQISTIDSLEGTNENNMLGKLIPVGTGFMYSYLREFASDLLIQLDERTIV